LHGVFNQYYATCFVLICVSPCSENRAKLDKHVVVCGMPEMLHEFLEPFKTASAGQQTAQVVPLLFLWDGPISDRQMQVDPAAPSPHFIFVTSGLRC